ncbi:hypothetical protein EZV62_011037 [Acer yangbiense]|uniref:PI3K/PI4K catalytic domain-containing protein n=1 Tax=Acer yangbiense TaxID=1000413 RepID=A0A5C7I3E4_9ROSI|nr:hypothetical protein EZV62_011037 [Acer yangbiense]
MDQLYDRISTLLESNDVADNLGALRAIDELIYVALGENASKVSKLSNYMRTVFEVKRDRDVLVLASRVLGHLARAGGAMTADEVKFQVKMALDWLRGDRVEYRRFAAVLILKEMAENASTVFNVHVPEFVDAIWVALRDPTLAVRERTVEALRACLRVIEKRETRWRVQCMNLKSVLSLLVWTLALMYPLLVACKSISNLRRAAAQEVVDKVRQHSGVLVDQAQLVSKELIRVAILWHEMWHEALEEASRLYFGEHNIEGMLKVLEPLHEMLEEGAMRENTTIKESIYRGILIFKLVHTFSLLSHKAIDAYRHELLEAYDCCMKYKRTGKDAELTQSVSPELLERRNLELTVPGTYRADLSVVTIASFATQLVVITSKQRPRKLTIHRSDGDDYAFLLKGHEDLRQDEHVMQLFGLVNTLLENSRKTMEKDLSIQRYDVIPLSPNSGLIGWVPNCDTLHHLIRDYRDAKKVGYLLGLCDRHPSNLMLHRYSGKIFHIDFGDCFEASMNREKFSEKVPFRSTRMLIKAMEVSDLEGNFCSTSSANK